MVTQGHRKSRLAGTIRKHLALELARVVKDPRLDSLCIEGVELTGDLGLAKVNVRLMVGGDDPAFRRDAMGALARLSPGLRASLGPVLRMRRLPELRFHYDEGADHRARIEAVLDEIKKDEAHREEPSASGESPGSSDETASPSPSSSPRESG